MANEPFGKLDHIGIAVKSTAEARKFYEGALGARFLYEHENPEAGYKILEFDMSGLTIELLEQQGENIVNEREFPDSYEAFISPRSSHGVLIQIGSGYPTLARAAEWFKK